MLYPLEVQQSNFRSHHATCPPQSRHIDTCVFANSTLITSSLRYQKIDQSVLGRKDRVVIAGRPYDPLLVEGHHKDSYNHVCNHVDAASVYKPKRMLHHP